MNRSHEQLLEALREAGGEREDREPERGADDHRAAADLVGEHAEEERPDEHADVGGRRRSARAPGAVAPKSRSTAGAT